MYMWIEIVKNNLCIQGVWDTLDPNLFAVAFLKSAMGDN